MNFRLHVPLRRCLIAIVAPMLTTAFVLQATATCPDGPFDPPTLPNVIWTFTDSIAACPSGDSLTFSHPSQHRHPSRLRFLITYQDDNCDPRTGVPPESVYVVITTNQGNVVAKDVSPYTYADDSTDFNGQCRIIIPSFSGCGRLRANLYVSGVDQGTKYVIVRTTDPDGDGRTESSESSSACDINYDGTINIWDLLVANPNHIEHSHRLALHGTLVRRTNFCDACSPNMPNTIGEGRVFWSPNGRWLSYTIHEPNLVDVCNAYIVPSDATVGTNPTKITFATTREGSVYDPTWSPLGNELVYEKFGMGLHRKGIPGLGDTTEQTVIVVSDPDRVVYPAFCPDADSVAFTYLLGAGTINNLSTIAIVNGQRRELTHNVQGGSDDRYPSWASDGRMLVVDRELDVSGNRRRHLYKVSINGGVAPFLEPTDLAESAKAPYYSPDSQIVVCGLGSNAARWSLAGEGE